MKLVVESSVPLANIWNSACNMAPVLRKQAAGAWVELRDDRPKQGSLRAYYLDDTLIENCSLGCDGGSACSALPLRADFTMSTLEYVQTGTRPPPPLVSPCVTDQPVPVIVSQDSLGPYEFDLRYMLENCPSNELQSKRWEIPAE